MLAFATPARFERDLMSFCGEHCHNKVKQMTSNYGIAEIVPEPAGTHEWLPEVREETTEVLSTLGITDPGDQEHLLEVAVEILRRSVPVPPDPGSHSVTGLAVG